MLPVLMAILAEKLVLTEKEAELLSKELGTSMLPSEFKAARRVVRKILQQLD